jgi:hypothetical protein
VSFLAATPLWDTNLIAALVGAVVGGLIGLASSTFALILTAHHDRYKRDLEERANSLHLMSALLDEIKHLQSSINEALQKVNHLVETSILDDIPTDRFKTDFLQAARLRIARISSASGVFAGVTRALHEVEHCNGMLDRYENECKKVGSTSYTLQQLTGSGIADDTKSVLKSTATSMQSIAATIESTRKSVADCRPRLIPSWVPSKLAKLLEPTSHP